MILRAKEEWLPIPSELKCNTEPQFFNFDDMVSDYQVTAGSPYESLVGSSASSTKSTIDPKSGSIITFIGQHSFIPWHTIPPHILEFCNAGKILPMTAYN